MDCKDEIISFLVGIKSKSVVVEGKRDEEVLKRIGFNDIQVLNRTKGIFDASDKLPRNVSILTDFDTEGEEIAKKLSEVLKKMGKRVDAKNRKALRKLFLKNMINTIEGLKKLL